MNKIIDFFKSIGLIDLLHSLTLSRPKQPINLQSILDARPQISEMFQSILEHFKLDNGRFKHLFRFWDSDKLLIQYFQQAPGIRQGTAKRWLLHQNFLAPIIKIIQARCFLCHVTFISGNLVFMDDVARKTACAEYNKEYPSSRVSKTNLYPKPTDCALRFPTNIYCYGSNHSFGLIHWEAGCHFCNNKNGTEKRGQCGSNNQSKNV